FRMPFGKKRNQGPNLAEQLQTVAGCIGSRGIGVFVYYALQGGFRACNVVQFYLTASDYQQCIAGFLITRIGCDHGLQSLDGTVEVLVGIAAAAFVETGAWCQRAVRVLLGEAVQCSAGFRVIALAEQVQSAVIALLLVRIAYLWRGRNIRVGRLLTGLLGHARLMVGRFNVAAQLRDLLLQVV